MATRGYEATESQVRACGKQQILGSAASAEFPLERSFQISENRQETLFQKIILTTNVARKTHPTISQAHLVLHTTL